MNGHRINGVTVRMNKVDFSTYKGKMAIYLSDGRIILTPIGMFPDIKRLTMKQRKDYFILEGQYLGFMRQPEMYPVTDFLRV